MFTHSTSKVSNDHVEHLVKSILNRRDRKLREQQQTFIRRNTDENNKRNNYLLDKFVMKKPVAKENIDNSMKKLISPKKKPPDDDDDDDFVSIKKPPPPPPKLAHPPKINPIKSCLEAIITQIENEEATCPICNEILSDFPTIDQRERHVNQCLEESQIKNIETKQQKSLLSYPKFTSSIRKSSVTSNFKCQICGMSFTVKRTYLTHLKKCSNQNSVQLKHLVNFASKTTTTTNETTDKKKPAMNIKNRVIRMEVPINEDDEQQQLAIALSASIKTATEPPNAFDILQAAAKKTKTIDLLHTPLWNVSNEDKFKLSSKRLSDLCERVIDILPTKNRYQFPPSLLLQISQMNFGEVDWWNITTTNPHDDEIPMTQLVQILDENTDDSVI